MSLFSTHVKRAVHGKLHRKESVRVCDDFFLVHHHAGGCGVVGEWLLGVFRRCLVLGQVALHASNVAPCLATLHRPPLTLGERAVRGPLPGANFVGEGGTEHLLIGTLVPPQVLRGLDMP